MAWPCCGLCWPGRCLRFSHDACVSQPGSRGTDWRVHSVFDLGRGRFWHLDLTDKHGAEALERGALHEGEIRIDDRNYARASVLQRFRAQSGGKADLIVQLGWNALQLSNRAARPFDLISYLHRLPHRSSPNEANLGAAVGGDEPLCARPALARQHQSGRRHGSSPPRERSVKAKTSYQITACAAERNRKDS